MSKSRSLKYPAGTIIQDIEHPNELGLIIETDAGTFQGAYRVYSLVRYGMTPDDRVFDHGDPMGQPIDPTKSNGCKTFWCYKDYVENRCNILSIKREEKG